jgi:hypothetical protein
MAIEGTNWTSTAGVNTSALVVEDARDAVVQFCLFDSNRGINCLMLNERFGSESLRCLGFRGNICEDGASEFKGMFCIYNSWTIENSVFENNKVIWIVGQYAMSRAFTLTFRRCQFDVFKEFVQGKAKVDLDDCDIGAGTLPPWGQCPNRTPRRTMSRSDSVVAGGLDAGVIAGVVVALVAVTSLVIVAVVCWFKRQSGSDGFGVERNVGLDTIGNDEAAMGARWSQGAT